MTESVALTAVTPGTPPSRPTVTLLTALAATADLTPAEYRAHLRPPGGRPQPAQHRAGLAVGRVATPGGAGMRTARRRLDRERKNELRAWAGLPELPLSPGEAVAAQAHPDAAVYLVGAGPASRVVLVGVGRAGGEPARQRQLHGDRRMRPTMASVQAVTGHQAARGRAGRSIWAGTRGNG